MTKLTINDIARLSGVGKSTVSRVLNHDAKVSDETRAKVQNIITQYGFQPSKSARAMRGVSAKTVGIIVSRLSSGSENQALATMLPLLYAHQCEPIIVESQFKPELVHSHLNYFMKRGVDGVILFAFSELEEESLLNWQHKMVVIARNYPQISSVYYDDEKAIALLMARLSQHRAISYIGVNDEDRTTGYLRHQAYLDACKIYQISPRSIQGELGYEWAYQNVHQILNQQTSALLCATDAQAIGAIKYLQEQNLLHIQVGNIGKNPLLRFLFPTIFSVDLGAAHAGEIAVNQLLLLLEKQTLSHYCVDCFLIP